MELVLVKSGADTPCYINPDHIIAMRDCRMEGKQYVKIWLSGDSERDARVFETTAAEVLKSISNLTVV